MLGAVGGVRVTAGSSRERRNNGPYDSLVARPVALEQNPADYPGIKEVYKVSRQEVRTDQNPRKRHGWKTDLFLLRYEESRLRL
jgi:hypothetical protein